MLQALTLQTYGFVPLTRLRRDLRKGVYSASILYDGFTAFGGREKDVAEPQAGHLKL